MPRVVLLDVDGTLVDSNDAHVDAWVEALRGGGYDVTREDIRPLVGMGGDNILPTAAGLSKETNQGAEIADAWKRVFQERYLDGLKAMPGSRQLVQRLLEAGLEVVVATSSAPEMVQVLLEKAEVADLLPRRTTAGDAARSKPDPDIIQAALEEARCAPEEAVMIGDTPYDVQAAGRAGVRTIALRCGGFSDEDLRGAAAIYDDPADLAERIWESLLAAGVPAAG